MESANILVEVKLWITLNFYSAAAVPLFLKKS